MSPLEDLYQTRTCRDRKGTILAKWNHVLLFRDLDRLINEGVVERVRNVREISPDQRDTLWYQETSTRNLYVYVAGWSGARPSFGGIQN